MPLDFTVIRELSRQPSRFDLMRQDLLTPGFLKEHMQKEYDAAEATAKEKPAPEGSPIMDLLNKSFDNGQ